MVQASKVKTLKVSTQIFFLDEPSTTIMRQFIEWVTDRESPPIHPPGYQRKVDNESEPITKTKTRLGSYV